MTKVAVVKSLLVGGTNSNDQLAGRPDPNLAQLVDHHCDKCAIICDDNTTY